MSSSLMYRRLSKFSFSLDSDEPADWLAKEEIRTGVARRWWCCLWNFSLSKQKADKDLSKIGTEEIVSFW